jgi:predicted nucleotidyltransferase component of viral defense system
VYRESYIKKSEALQLIILNNIYAQSGSESMIFQGGTALRWIYGGMRFSEDLDFVSHLSAENIENFLNKATKKMQNTCLAQFGAGQLELQKKRSRKQAAKYFFIFRPDEHRARIAVRVEFERLKTGTVPGYEKFILRDLPAVSNLVVLGHLIMPYSSSIILAETPEEILSDKIRALYERKYLKGRDFYDIWWLANHMRVKSKWAVVQKKLMMYETEFMPARKSEFFIEDKYLPEIRASMNADLPRFIPQNIFSKYQEDNFNEFIEAVRRVITVLRDQGLKEYF